MTPRAGATSQGSKFFGGFQDDGFPVFDLESDHPVYFDTTGWGDCSDGGQWTFHFVGDARSDAFGGSGNHLRVLQRRRGRYGSMTSHGTLVLDATYDRDGMRGRISYRERFEPRDAPEFACSAEGVRFSVQR